MGIGVREREAKGINLMVLCWFIAHLKGVEWVVAFLMREIHKKGYSTLLSGILLLIKLLYFPGIVA